MAVPFIGIKLIDVALTTTGLAYGECSMFALKEIGTGIRMTLNLALDKMKR
jgi:hypothetical protein